jgi:hypothetical protein
MRSRHFGGLVLLLVGLIGILVGCGGGGGSTAVTITGTVYSPTAGLFSRSLSTIGAGVPVTLGTVSNDGTVFTPYAGASALTDESGRYAIPLPAEATFSPRLNVVVGDTARPTMTSIVLDRAADIRPATTAARDELYTLARAQGTAVSALDTTTVRAFLQAAVTAAVPAETGATVADALANAHTALNASMPVTTALKAIVPQATGAITPVRLAPDFGVRGQTTQVTIVGFGLSPAPTITENPTSTGVTAAVVSSTDTSLVVDFTVQASATPGFHYLTMSRGGQTAQIAFFVRTAQDPPALLSMTPSLGGVSATIATTVHVTLTGLAFNVPGATVQLSAGTIVVSAVHVVSATQITATFTIPAGHPAGKYLVSVRTDAGTSGGVTFTVSTENHAHVTPPTLTSISPNAYTIPANATSPISITVHVTGALFANPTVAPYLSGPFYFHDVRNVTATSCDATLTINPAFTITSIPVTLINGDQGVSNSLTFSLSHE